jgi:hypothetical protein
VVLLPRRSTGRYGWLGIAVPAIALGIGVLILNVVAAGPHAIALLAIVATPVLAAARPRRAPVALALWLVAWLAHGLVAQGAAVALIALAVMPFFSAAATNCAARIASPTMWREILSSQPAARDGVALPNTNRNGKRIGQSSPSIRKFSIAHNSCERSSVVSRHLDACP